MSDTEIWHRPGNPTGVESTFTTSGMVIEDINRPGGGRRFRFQIPADTGIENLTPAQAAELGRWLIAQADQRAE